MPPLPKTKASACVAVIQTCVADGWLAEVTYFWFQLASVLVIYTAYSVIGSAIGLPLSSFSKFKVVAVAPSSVGAPGVLAVE